MHALFLTPHAWHVFVNPHRRHANRTLTLKCIVRIWTSGGLSVDCIGTKQNYRSNKGYSVSGQPIEKAK